MPSLNDLVNFCNHRVSVDRIKDFSGSFNGLQIENNGSVNKVGAAVDAGLVPLKMQPNEMLTFLLFIMDSFGFPLSLSLVPIIARHSTA